MNHLYFVDCFDVLKELKEQHPQRKAKEVVTGCLIKTLETRDDIFLKDVISISRQDIIASS